MLLFAKRMSDIFVKTVLFSLFVSLDIFAKKKHKYVIYDYVCASKKNEKSSIVIVDSNKNLKL
jgi:hypothetical protein